MPTPYPLTLAITIQRKEGDSNPRRPAGASVFRTDAISHSATLPSNNTLNTNTHLCVAAGAGLEPATFKCPLQTHLDALTD